MKRFDICSSLESKNVTNTNIIWHIQLTHKLNCVSISYYFLWTNCDMTELEIEAKSVYLKSTQIVSSTSRFTWHFDSIVDNVIRYNFFGVICLHVYTPWYAGWYTYMCVCIQWCIPVTFTRTDGSHLMVLSLKNTCWGKIFQVVVDIS